MPQELSLEFVYDVSGTPYENTYFGLFTLNQATKVRLVREFTTTFPTLTKVKGRQLRKKEFIDIIRFLDERKVRMRVCSFTRHDWRYYLNINSYRKDNNFKIKIASMIFYELAKNIIWSDCCYSLTSCVESQLGNVDDLFKFLNKLASSRDVQFECTHGRGAYNRVVQIADYIAYSGRMIKESDLAQFEHYEFVTARFNEHELKFLF